MRGFFGIGAAAPEPAPNLMPELYAARRPSSSAYSSDDDSGLVDEVYSVNTSDENRLERRRRPMRSSSSVKHMLQPSLDPESDESASLTDSKDGSQNESQRISQNSHYFASHSARRSRRQLLLTDDQPARNRSMLQRTTMIVRSADRDLAHESLFRFRVSLSGDMPDAQHGTGCRSELPLRGVRLVRAYHASLPERIITAPCAADQLPRSHLYLGFEGLQGQRRTDGTSLGARGAHQILHRSDRDDARFKNTAVFTAVDSQDAASEPLRQAAAFTLTVSTEENETEDTPDDLLQIARTVLIPQTQWDLADIYAGINSGGSSSSGGESSGGTSEIAEVLASDAARLGTRVAIENIDRYFIRAVRFYPATAEIAVFFASEIPAGRLREGDRLSFHSVRIDRQSETFAGISTTAQQHLLAIEQVIFTPQRARTVVRLHELPEGIIAQSGVLAGYSEPGDGTVSGGGNNGSGDGVVYAAVLRVSDELTRAARALRSLVRVARGDSSSAAAESMIGGGDSATADSIADDESNYYEIPIERSVDPTSVTELSAFHLAPFALNESLQFSVMFDIVHEMEGGRVED